MTMNGSGWPTFSKTIIVLGTLLGALILYYGRDILIILFVAIVVASAIRPLVDSLVRFTRFRALAVLLIYIVLLGSLAGLILVSVPPLIALTVEFVTGGTLVTKIQELANEARWFGWSQFRLVIPTVTLPEQLQSLVGQAGDVAQQMAIPVAIGTVTGVGHFILALLMTFYWLTARQQMLDLILRVSPPRHRSSVEVIWTDIEETLGAYLRGQVILMSSIGILSVIGLLALGVPYAPALAVVAAITEVIPMIGPFIGAVPALMVGFTISTQTGILVGLMYLVIQQFENHILVPKVMQRSTGLHPLLVIVALFVGASLNGIMGAVIAVPIAGAIEVIARHMLIEPAIQSHTPKVDGGIVVFEPEHGEPRKPGESTALLQRGESGQ